MSPWNPDHAPEWQHQLAEEWVARQRKRRPEVADDPAGEGSAPAGDGAVDSASVLNRDLD